MDTTKKILIADASSFDRSLMCNSLKNTYTIIESNSGNKTLELFVEEIDNIKLAIIDIALPYVDGLDVLFRIKTINKGKNIPIIIIATQANKPNVLRAFKYGASDFIRKPFDADFFRQRVLSLLGDSSKIPGKALYKLVNSNETHIEDIKEYDRNMNKVLKDLYSFRKIETPHHLKRVSLFSGVLLKLLSKNTASGIQLTETQIEIIVRASTYHDVGKLAIPDSILANVDFLDAEEETMYQSHTLKGAELLQLNNNPHMITFSKIAIDIAKYHHESWDGSGYPEGLKGNKIPLAAQIIGCATSLDKFSREYYGIVDNVFEIAMEQILINQNHFNPLLIRALTQSESFMNKIINKYPDSRT